MKQFYKKEIVLKQLDLQHSKPDNREFKLKAYERLALLCERIKIPNLIYRLNTPDLNVSDLRRSLILTIQHEYDHNLAQQLYISENLWKIIQLAKDEMLHIVMTGGSELNDLDSADLLAKELFASVNSLEFDPIMKALAALRKEVKLVI
jgi:hypothetical protein